MAAVIVAILINNYIHKFMRTIESQHGSHADKELKKGLK